MSCLDRAWHAGESTWNQVDNCNDFSIGIELEGSDYDIFETEQYKCLEKLIQSIVKKYPIESIVGHSDISPTRKTDPGPCFDWKKIESYTEQLKCKR